MHRILLWFVIGLTFLLGFIEGVGVRVVHSYFVFFLIPILVGVILLILHKKNANTIPPLAIIGWLLLLTSVVLSTFGSSMLKHESLVMSFLFFHFCAFYLLGNIYKRELTSLVPKLIFVWALANTLYSVYIFVTKTQLDNAYQFVYATFGSHNHGGELSALALIILLFTPISLVSRIVIAVPLIMSIILSFSRSAYMWTLVVLLVGMFLYRVKVYVGPAIIGIISVLLIGVGLISTIRPLPVSHFAPIQNILIEKFHLEPRSIISGRDAYFAHSVQAISDNLFWGSGVGSFGFATRRYSPELRLHTDHAHNLFLEIGVEQGLLGLIGILCIMVPVLWNLIRNKPTATIALPFLFLLTTFQTDYIYAINGIFLLFFLLAGMLTTTKTQRTSQVLLSIVVGFAVIQIAWIDMVIASSVALGFNKPHLAVKLYPLSVTAYHKALKSLSYEQARWYVDGYVYASPNTTTYLDVASFYTINNNDIEAIPYYEKAVLSNPSLDLTHIITYATLLNTYHSPRQSQTLKEIFVKTYNSYELYEIPEEIHPKIREACALIQPSCSSISWFSEIESVNEE